MQSKLCGSILGAVVVNVVLLLHTDVPVQAAWGWKMTVDAGASYTCAEGTSIGCDSPTDQASKDCNNKASNYDCTVVAKAGYTCTQKKLSVQCDSIKGVFTGAVPNKAACINIGNAAYNLTKDSNLKWSPSDPGCTTGVTTTAATTKAATTKAASSDSTKVSALAGLSVLVVANTPM
jgi:hypothetical protein